LTPQLRDSLFHRFSAKEHGTVPQVPELVVSLVGVAYPVPQRICQLLFGSQELVVRRLPIPSVVFSMLGAQSFVVRLDLLMRARRFFCNLFLRHVGASADAEIAKDAGHSRRANGGQDDLQSVTIETLGPYQAARESRTQHAIPCLEP
jgi:hypothetical protein